MFTLKFYSDTGNDRSQTVVVSCNSYALYEENTGQAQIVIHTIDESAPDLYKTKPDEDFDREEGAIYFDTCYIENSSGKTIDRIHKRQV